MSEEQSNNFNVMSSDKQGFSRDGTGVNNIVRRSGGSVQSVDETCDAPADSTTHHQQQNHGDVGVASDPTLQSRTGSLPVPDSPTEYRHSVQISSPERVFGGGGEETIMQTPPGRYSEAISFATVVILFVVNLLNYMDRFTIAGVLDDVQKYYNLNNSEAGLLQTSFVCSYMIFAPIFGYLGDRYSRRAIMAFGITFWSITTLAGSFVPDGHFWWFLICRGLVGVGEASYSTIAPTIIADMYTGNKRSRMLALFYFAIPVGSGLGYITGSNVASLANSWHWALRVTPPLGLICAVLVIVVMKDPPRGESEGGAHLHATSYKKDTVYLLKNASFMWSTVGFTCVAFVAGALSWWGPIFLMRSIQVQGHEATQEDVSFKFGIITVVAGVIGVASGSAVSSKLKEKHLTADPLVCAFGMITSMPFLFLCAVLSKYNTPLAFALIFFGETLLCLNWSLVADILLYVVIPTRRSTAEAFQILFSHAFGDAGSPYIIGAVSDALAAGKSDTPMTRFVSLEYALFITCFVNVIGGFSFLVCAWYIVEDRKKADDIIKGWLLEEDGVNHHDSLTMKTSNGKDDQVNHNNSTKVVNGVPRTSL